MDMWSGATKYMGTQNSGFFNVLLQNEFNDAHKLTLSLGGTADFYNESLSRRVMTQTLEPGRQLTEEYAIGLGGEYTFHAGEKFSSILGLRADWFNGEGFRLTPRLTLKYAPIEAVVLRANAGRGLRRALPLIDNIGVFSTGKAFDGIFNTHLLEDAWTYGGNATFYLPFGASSNTYIGLDFFGTSFNEQMVVDYENIANTIDFYALDGKRSFSRSYQIDFNVEPVRRLTVSATFRYTDARIEMKERGLTEKPLTSRYKGVLNLQYATNLNKWVFDFTASINGKSRVYNFMEDLRDENGKLLYKEGYSPAYPLLYLQVTKRFKGIDIYLGAENLTNFRQKNLLVGTPMEETAGHGGMAAVNTALPDFDASAVWGPIMGTKVYIGLRYTLWK